MIPWRTRWLAPNPRLFGARLPAGKFFMSAGNHQLAMLCHLPKELSEKKNVSKKGWVDAVLAVLPGAEVPRSLGSLPLHLARMRCVASRDTTRHALHMGTLWAHC